MEYVKISDPKKENITKIDLDESNNIPHENRFLISGWRLFFLLSTIVALVFPLLFVLNLKLSWNLLSNRWHGHEMIFGFGGSAVLGFLCAAIPNWTKNKLPKYIPIVLLILWIANRVIMFALPMEYYWLTSILWFVGALLFAKEVMNVGSTHNYSIALTLAIIGVADLLFSLMDNPNKGFTLALYTIFSLVVVIGGRITPAFTRNWLRKKYNDPSIDYKNSKLLMVLAVIISLFSGIIVIIPQIPSVVKGIYFLVLTIILIMRFVHWHGLKTLSDPLVWVLHLMYLCVICTSLFSALTQFKIHHFSTFHSIGIWVIGVAIMAVSSRAALGHTGRPLKVSNFIAIAYILIFVSGIFRMFAPTHELRIMGSGLLWTISWLIYAINFAPVLLKKRIDGKQG